MLEKPFIFWQLKLLEKMGLNNVTLCLGHHSEKIIRGLDEFENLTVSPKFILDGPEPLGTGGAIKQALNGVVEDFLVIYGDSLLPIDLADIYDNFKHSHYVAMTCCIKNKNAWDKQPIGRTWESFGL